MSNTEVWIALGALVGLTDKKTNTDFRDAISPAYICFLYFLPCFKLAYTLQTRHWRSGSKRYMVKTHDAVEQDYVAAEGWVQEMGSVWWWESLGLVLWQRTFCLNNWELHPTVCILQNIWNLHRVFRKQNIRLLFLLYNVHKWHLVF